MLIDANLCSNKVQLCFLLSERTFGASPVIFFKEARKPQSYASSKLQVIDYSQEKSVQVLA